VKTVSLTAGLACLAWTLHGQGVVAFNTLGGGVNAPAINLYTEMRVTGNTFYAQLFWAEGNVTDPLSSGFTQVTNPPAFFGTGATAGYITSTTGGGNRRSPDFSW
jgi:hypothetical protein